MKNIIAAQAMGGSRHNPLMTLTVTQCSIPKALTKMIPTVNMNCMQAPMAPLMEVSVTSPTYTGGAKAKPPQPTPIRAKKILKKITQNVLILLTG